MNADAVVIRSARREDVAAIVAMLADDHLGRARALLPIVAAAASASDWCNGR